MTIRDDEEIPFDVLHQLKRQYDVNDLVEFLGLTIEDIIDSYTFEILDRVEELEAELGITREEEDEDDESKY